jgi:uncharacterized damage-inducible protein DinB
MLKALLCTLALGTALLHAQADPYEGLWQGFDGEWSHVSKQLLALAEAIPAEKYAWRPGAGVRSTSEVLNHITLANFGLMSYTGVKFPADMTRDFMKNMERSVTAKAEVVEWLKRSLEAVRKARASVRPADLPRKVRIDDRHGTVEGIYLRIIIHANEHMGQLVAYARVNGIAPPWSAGQ